MSRAKRRSLSFIAITTFFFSFIAARLWVVFTRADIPIYGADATYFGRNVVIGGVHVHHFLYGIVLLGVGGWIALMSQEYGSRKLAAVLYGAGLGFFVDEIGFLLTWGEYWSSLTYAIVLLTAVAFINAVYFTDFWREVRKNIVLSSEHYPFASKFLRIPFLIEAVDKLSSSVSRAEKVSLVFAGIVYLGAGVAILVYPGLLYYWVAGGFILGGVSHFVRLLRA